MSAGRGGVGGGHRRPQLLPQVDVVFFSFMSLYHLVFFPLPILHHHALGTTPPPPTPPFRTWYRVFTDPCKPALIFNAALSGAEPST